METFLHSVAKFILENHSNDLKNSCVVFPNQRSEAYFSQEIGKLNKENPKVIWLPRYFTIDEFIHSIANQRIASQTTQLATLFRVYQQVSKELGKESNETFDRFYPWAQIILADFNDIDKYLVDARSLLQNIQDIKEIDNVIDYLTDEQRQAISEFFNVTLGGDNSELKDRFLSIWECLLPMYDNFNKQLSADGLTYEGQVYRQASERVKSPEYQFPFSKVFFIGFNAITHSEESIFESLQSQGRAVFFWDYDDEYINNDLHEAGLFMRRFVRKFKMPDGLNICHSFSRKDKNISIVASPTVSGQMTVASEQLAKIPDNELSETAIVLSDESLLMGILEHTSPYISERNVTMGYKVKNSVAGQWVELLMQLQSNKRVTADVTTFFYKNVLALLQHPFFAFIDGQFAMSMASRIKDEAIFQVPVDCFADSRFAQMVFESIDGHHQFSEYLVKILKQLMSVWAQLPDGENDNWLIHQEMVYRMLLQIQQLDTELKAENLVVEMPTYFQLVRKCFNSLKVPFEGESIKGLQIMGFLETRNIDFKNLVILNVNEGTLPVDGNTTSFIPFGLRRGFGLPTHEEREAMYAYYFYRLIQRADNITLTYFVGKAEGKKGEPSRYILQLVYGDYNVTEKMLQSNVSFSASGALSMAKNDYTMQLLDAYVADGKSGDEGRALSPSALVIYQKCPLQFYFSKVLRLEPDDDIEENIDARQFGNIFHDAMHLIYSGFLKKTVSGDDIRNLDKDYIRKNIDKAFVKVIFPKKKNFEQEIETGNLHIQKILNGNNNMIYNIITKYVNEQLNYDAKTADIQPIEFLSLEDKYTMEFPIVVDGRNLNIKLGGYIDRVDKTDDVVRIIDYKTGRNDIVCDSVEDIFKPENIDAYKGVLQTLIYCMVYNSQHPDLSVLSSYLFKTTELNTGIDFKIHSKASKDKQDAFADGNYLRVSELVNKFVVDILSDIFDKNKPFVQTDNVNECKKCNFFYFCGK